MVPAPDEATTCPNQKPPPCHAVTLHVTLYVTLCVTLCVTLGRQFLDMCHAWMSQFLCHAQVGDVLGEWVGPPNQGNRRNSTS